MSDDLHKKAGPILLLAGPGTGKTYRLAKRIKHLVVESQVSPSEITVITFTAAAAKQMRDRISNLEEEELYLESANQPSSIRTMHSLGLRILKDERAKLPFPCDNVVTNARQQALLCEDGAQLAGFTRNDAEETLNARRLGDGNPSDQKISAIAEKYEQILRACAAIDYDDQIFLACKVLQENQELLRDYQLQCRHLLIDEYQDINKAQFELIKLLADGHHDGLFVVGDDDQSIYSWRGGSPEFIRRFQKDFEDHAQVIPLQVSYRCHQHILEGATSVVAKFDPDRLKKGPFIYKRAEGPKIQVHSAPSDEKEARIVRAIIEAALPKQDILVLVPRQGFATALVRSLTDAKIPFSAQLSAPGEGLFAMNYLARWLRDPSDSLSFRLCLNDFLNVHKDVPSAKARNAEKKQRREEIFLTVSKLWLPVVQRQIDSLWDALLKSATSIKILEEARDTFSKIKELFSAGDTPQFAAEIIKALGPWSTPTEMMDEMREWVSLFERSTPQGQAASVRVMTFQGSKGLEASVVCVLGVEEGTLPRASGDPEPLAEQARLFYVSATRAKNELHLFHARKRSGAIVFRNIYSGGAPDLKESQFLAHIDKSHKDTKYHPA